MTNLTYHPFLPENKTESIRIVVGGQTFTEFQNSEGSASNVVARVITDLVIDYSILYNSIVGHLEVVVPVGDPLEKEVFEGNTQIAIIAVDSLGKVFSGAFTAYKSSTIDVIEGKRIKYFFVDSLSYTALNLKRPKNLKDKSLNDILNDEVFNSKNENGQDENIFKIFSTKETDFKVDTTIPFMEFKACAGGGDCCNYLNNLGQRFNALVFQTRNKYRAISWDKVMDQEVLKEDGEEVTYVYPSNFVSNVFSIKWKDIGQLDSSKTAIAGNLTEDKFHFDALTGKTIQPDKQTIESSISTLNRGGAADSKAITEAKENIGIKMTSTYNADLATKYKYYMSLFDSSKVTIIVPGTYVVNVGDLVQLKISLGGKEEESKDDGPSKTLSGKYLVSRITEKYVMGFFSQKIELTRPGIQHN